MATLKERAQAQAEKTKGAARATYETVKDAAQSGYATTQDTLQTGWEKTQNALLDFFNLRRAKANEPLRQTRRSWQDIQGTVQDRVRSAMAQTQAKLQRGVGKTQGAVGLQTKQAARAMEQASKNLEKAQKRFLKAQKNLQEQLGGTWGNVQDTLQERMEAARAKTRRMLGKGTIVAGRGLTRTAANLQQMKENLQEQRERQLRRRLRARALFRWGLVIGVIAALLFTPTPGAEIRRRIVALWGQARTRLAM